jgi:hypothetical protein
MIGAVWKLIVFISMANRIINASSNERIIVQVYDAFPQMFDVCTLGHTAHIEAIASSCHPLISTRPSCTFSFTKTPRCLKVIPPSNAIGRWGSLMNCHRNPRWTETTDSCFTNCSTQNAFCSGVAIIAVLRHRSSEKRGAGMRMRTKLEHLLLRSMWETYFCVCFQYRNGRLKQLHSFWYTL